MKTYERSKTAAQVNRETSGAGRPAKLQRAAKRFLVDKRGATLTIQRLHDLTKNEPLRAMQQAELKTAGAASLSTQRCPPMADNRAVATQFKRLVGVTAADIATPDEFSAPPVQHEKRPNNTGLPVRLKSGIESLSGMSMDHLEVHYNSGKPAQLHAHAYAQGSEIHLGPGQERHLPHEAWHVVQQAQGRVKPTRRLKGNVSVNDDVGLEAEANAMGAKAIAQIVRPPLSPVSIGSGAARAVPIQRAKERANTPAGTALSKWDTDSDPKNRLSVLTEYARSLGLSGLPSWDKIIFVFETLPHYGEANRDDQRKGYYLVKIQEKLLENEDFAFAYSTLRHELIHVAQLHAEKTGKQGDTELNIFYNLQPGLPKAWNDYAMYLSEVETHAWEVRQGRNTQLSGAKWKERVVALNSYYDRVKKLPRDNKKADQETIDYFTKGRAVATRLYDEAMLFYYANSPDKNGKKNKKDKKKDRKVKTRTSKFGNAKTKVKIPKEQRYFDSTGKRKRVGRSAPDNSSMGNNANNA